MLMIKQYILLTGCGTPIPDPHAKQYNSMPLPHVAFP